MNVTRKSGHTERNGRGSNGHESTRVSSPMDGKIGALLLMGQSVSQSEREGPERTQKSKNLRRRRSGR